MNLLPSVDSLSLSNPRFGGRLGISGTVPIESLPALSDWLTTVLMGGTGSFHDHVNDAEQARPPKP